MQLHIDFTLIDQKAANRIAAETAKREGFSRIAKLHDEYALALHNAENWALANCPKGYTYAFTVNVEFVPKINYRYAGYEDVYREKD